MRLLGDDGCDEEYVALLTMCGCETVTNRMRLCRTQRALSLILDGIRSTGSQPNKGKFPCLPIARSCQNSSSRTAALLRECISTVAALPVSPATYRQALDMALHMLTAGVRASVLSANHDHRLLLTRQCFRGQRQQLGVLGSVRAPGSGAWPRGCLVA